MAFTNNGNESNGILIENNGSASLLVSFGGIRMGLGMPVFEFYNSLENVPCDKIFITDPNQGWYHKGINSELTDIYKIAGFLKAEIEKAAYTNVCFIGNSMGGYAAMVFGSLLNVPHIIAFSPQTFIDKWNRFFFQDKRWSAQLQRVYGYPQRGREFFDLKKHLNSSSLDFTGNIAIYYSKKDKLDGIHAERLRKFESVNLNPYDFGGHQLIRALKESGQLSGIFSQIFK